MINFQFNIPKSKLNKRIKQLTKYTIGLTTKLYLYKKFGINIKYINKSPIYNKLIYKKLLKHIKKIKISTKKQQFLDKKKNIQKLIDSKTYLGLRHRSKLPIRGQRTKTNAKTQRKLKHF